MKIYTRRGDSGLTDLFQGGRVQKDDSRPKAYGDIDETQAVIGLARSISEGDLEKILAEVQRDLWILMAELACNPDRLDQLDERTGRCTPSMVGDLEKIIDDISSRFESPTEFVVPGETELAARLDFARTVCRRAERSSISVVNDDSAVVPYLNRLSDLLWTLARWQEGSSRTTRSVGKST